MLTSTPAPTMRDALNLAYYAGNVDTLPLPLQHLALAAHAAYETWMEMSQAMGAVVDMRIGTAPNMAASRAYIAAYELWQAIEGLAPQLAALPARELVQE